MNRTVVALYDDFNDANNALRELVDAGFTRENISLMASDPSGEYGRSIGTTAERADVEDSGAAQGAGVGAGIGAVVGGLGGLLVGLGALTIPGIGPVLAAGPLAAALTGLAGAGVGAVAGGVAGGLIGALVDLGVPEETAGYYAEGVRRGGTLLTVRTDDTLSDRAVDIMNRYNPVDINDRASQWRESGWTGFDTTAGPESTLDRDWRRDEQIDTTSSTRHDQDWRREQHGEAGIGTDAMRDRDWTDEQQISRDTTAAGYTSTTEFSTYDHQFRNHFDTSMAGSGYTYDQYQPAYRYGYDLARDDRYREYNWDRLEPEARQRWDERNPGTWDRFKNAVRHAWEEIKDTVD